MEHDSKKWGPVFGLDHARTEIQERNMSGRVQNKVVLVTAAGQGIGRAIAEALIAEGGIVIATDLADDKLHDLKAKKRQKLDVLSQPNVEALAKSVAGEFGAL